MAQQAQVYILPEERYSISPVTVAVKSQKGSDWLAWATCLFLIQPLWPKNGQLWSALTAVFSPGDHREGVPHIKGETRN